MMILRGLWPSKGMMLGTKLFLINDTNSSPVTLPVTVKQSNSPLSNEMAAIAEICCPLKSSLLAIAGFPLRLYPNFLMQSLPSAPVSSTKISQDDPHTQPYL